MSALAPERAELRPGPPADPDVPAPTGGLSRLAGWLAGDSNSRVWLRRKAVAAWMNILIATAAGVTVVTAGLMAGRPWPEPRTWGIVALKLFTLWCLAFLPGWLYVRFLDLRAKALWNEYVLSLHRLGWDLPWHLPMPPVASGFHDRWAQGPHGPAADNIYRQKFEAYYGRQITRATEGHLAGAADDSASDASAPYDGRMSGQDYKVRSESLFPVFLATAVLAVGWSAVLWNTRFVTDPAGAWDVLKYGFLGAYAFVTGMLVRRFFQSDLRPSAYATVVFRITLVLLIVSVLHQVLGGTTGVTSRAELAVAFVIGFFPLVGLQALQRVASRALGHLVPTVTSAYPLDQLDGFNLWYEARLTEEGVEDMQNLTTMNLVDVILHTRVPPGRLVDWTDQAFLLIHLEHAGRKELDEWQKGQGAGGRDQVPGAQARVKLRRVGIRTATDLLKAFSTEDCQLSEGLPRRTFSMPPDLEPPLPVGQLQLLVKVLAAERGLAPVWNWQRNGVPLACLGDGLGGYPDGTVSRRNAVSISDDSRGRSSVGR